MLYKSKRMQSMRHFAIHLTLQLPSMNLQLLLFLQTLICIKKKAKLKFHLCAKFQVMFSEHLEPLVFTRKMICLILLELMVKVLPMLKTQSPHWWMHYRTTVTRLSWVLIKDPKKSFNFAISSVMTFCPTLVSSFKTESQRRQQFGSLLKKKHLLRNVKTKWMPS